MLRTLATAYKQLPTKFLPSTSCINFPITLTLTIKPVYFYHMSYLMDSKHDDRFVKIDRRAFHLYKDSILQFPNNKFNEKIFLIILIDCVRTKQRYEDFQQLAEFGLQRVNEFKQPLSIFAFATQLYLYNYPNKAKCHKLATKGFQFFAQNNTLKSSSYYVMKFLIFIEKNVGLSQFSDEQYKLINFTRFKPLFLCFTLEMFYENKLQHYETIKHLFELFTCSEAIVPFADIHHYKLASRKINDPKFKEFVQRLSKRLTEQRKDDGENQEKEGPKQIQISLDGQQQAGNISLAHSTTGNPIKKINRTNDQIKPQEELFSWEQAYANQTYRRYNYYPMISYATTLNKK